MTTTAIHTAIDELRFRLHGALYEPGDAQYDDACTLFNSMIERRPRYVARCAAPDDVIAALAFARGHGLEVAVRAGGHSVTGASLCDDGVVLDVRAMSDIDVDPVRRVARVGAGATWSQLDRATQVHGLATTGGRVSTTGVAGLTLGGGSGWLERKHGLACDNLIAVEMVTAEGELVRATAEQHADLFWALRGGGGNYGVVTSLEFRLHPVGPEVLGGLVLHPAERGHELLTLFRNVMNDAPEELGLAFAYFTAPDDPEVPAELRGKPAAMVAGMYNGPVGEGERVLRELRAFGPPAADFFAPVGYADFQCSIDDPPGYRNWWTAENLLDLSDEAIETIAAGSEGLPVSPSMVFIVPWGGALARVGADESPLAGRDTKFVVHPLMLWEDAAQDEQMIAFGRGWRDLLAPYASGTAYLNFLGDEGEKRTQAGFAPGNLERLARIKAQWDPDDVFRANRHIRPAE
ncbi:MAG TPA: FAD-binding oxidoreductase [Thermoleophilaceae bacterium]|nr:FAD-binding oxidoreductase [Thermoleophilaceae bacterium]